MDLKVKLGFVPSIRSRAGITDWCAELRARCIDALESMEGFEVVYPEAAFDGKTLSAEKGHTTTGAVANLDEGDVVAEYFRREGVDGLILCSLNFGDERSCSNIAAKLGVPVLVIATKEPPALDNASLARQSDSYCGNLSICSGLYRRRFHSTMRASFSRRTKSSTRKWTSLAGPWRLSRRSRARIGPGRGAAWYLLRRSALTKLP